MYLTSLHRTVLVILLVTIPWLLAAIYSWSYLVNAHLGEAPSNGFWMRISIVAGGVFCLVAVWLVIDGARNKQTNPLLLVFGFAGLYFLVEWPIKALLSVLHST